jgi:S-DNA-T family DNA segregation ATPase FtsK/SpoIIIE
MLLRHLRPSRPRDVEVTVVGVDATVADLCLALDPDRPVVPLVLDGTRVVPAATPLDRSGVGDGTVVERSDDRAVLGGTTGSGNEPFARFVVERGLDVGRVLDLDAPVALLGRPEIGSVDRLDGASDAAPVLAVEDPTVSRRHAVVAVVGPEGAIGGVDTIGIREVEATNATALDGVALPSDGTMRPWPVDSALACGSAVLRRVPGRVLPPGRPVADGPPPWPHHRPPAPEVEVSDEEPLAPPEPLGDPPPVTPIGVIAVIASVGLAAVMVVLLKSWMFAAFAALGPVLLLASALDSRRRRRTETRRGRRRRAADLADLDAALVRRRELARDDLDDHFPPLHRALASATLGPAGLEPDPTCWSSRPGDPAAFAVVLGRGPARWHPPVEGVARRWAPDVRRVVDGRRILPGGPVVVRPEPGVPIAIVGPSEPARRLARSILLQTVVRHGPADLRVAVLTAPDAAPGWAWCRWLPHTAAPGSGRLLAGSDEAGARLLDVLLADVGTDDDRPPRRSLVVLDDAPGLGARRSAVRSLMRAASSEDTAITAVVVVEDASAVPAGCAVVTVDAGGRTTAPFAAVGPFAADGVAVDVATDAARALARLEDPEVDDPGRGLPARADLVGLVGADRLSATALGARWRAAGNDPAPAGVLGVGLDGPVVVDLATDGPHALVAGTTGAGKSELLRSFVTALAVSCSPDHLTFVLVDFKGGSAFDACGRFPHTTGVVTDLDARLAERALRCLEAELRHRERRLRSLGAVDLTAFRAAAGPDEDPLPRLVVVVDEFATLAAELPDFVESLVGIAQRGRSLGVHLILATQRPAGAVSDNIRANTALRIALRVNDRSDSSDVVDAPDAAALPRRRPGRALVRFGPGELTTIQAAYVGAGVLRGARESGVRAAPLTLDGEDATCGSTPDPSGGAADGPSDLEVLAGRLTEAWATLGGRPPRSPWPDPLPTRLPWPEAVPEGTVTSGGGRDALVLGRADDPDRQRQLPYSWRPGDGSLLVVGVPGSGTSTTLATVALEAARRWSPAACHVHVIDHGSSLGALAGLPQVGAVVGGDETERQRRLLEDLAEDLVERRRSPGAAAPRRLLLLDGLGAFRDTWADDPDGTWAAFLDVLGRGPEHGISCAVVAEGASRAPHQVLSLCRQRLVLRLGDPSEHGLFGIPASLAPGSVPGRAVDPDGPTVLQVAFPARGLAAEVAACCSGPPSDDDDGRAPAGTADGAPRVEPRPPAVRVLPRRVTLAQACAGAPTAVLAPDGSLRVTVGVSDHGLRPADLTLVPGGHALVAGPPRSGRSTTLATITRAVADADLPVLVVTGPGGSSPSDAGDGITTAGADELDALAAALAHRGPLVVVVDDADLLADAHPVLGPTVAARVPDRHVIVAARPDRLRSSYGHWLREVRVDRCGLLLAADRDLDGELLGARLPRVTPVRPRVGLAWGTGDPEGYLQVAVPEA